MHRDIHHLFPQEVPLTRPARVAVFAAAVVVLSACNEPTFQADGSPPTAAPAAQAASKGGSAQVQLAADMELSGKVKEALQEPGRRVEVAASEGVVTLYGTVEKPTDKDRIALAALEVEGVRSVVNNLVVMQGS
jgi:hypothetical protein